MNNWNQFNPHNLQYIEDQVKAIKEKHPEAFNDDKEETQERQIIDVLEEQLETLQQIRQLLEEQKRPKSFFRKS